jgi:hypothetical protein
VTCWLGVAEVAVVAVAVAAVEVAACVAAEARGVAVACAPAAARAAVIAEAVATAVAESAALLRCRARLIVHHRSVVPVAAVAWLVLDRAMEICQLRVGPALEVDQAPATSPAGQGAHDRASAVGRESVGGPARAVAHRVATCKTFSIFRVVDMPVGVAHQHVPAVLVQDLVPVRLRAPVAR